ncbi:hypothetical protein [Serratia ficaria]|uniref:hypothetical protein n=1 Tax=Serratia ficaria TaxID=61651 RepID=UPI0021BD1E85|nr:hypothetical protein [Serratia ficaria]
MMLKHVRIRALMLLMAMLVALNGCTSYHAVAVGHKPLSHSTYLVTDPPLYAGDKIRYQLNNGQKGEMVVARLTPQAIVGQNGATLSAAELSSLEKQAVSAAKTGAAVGGGIAATTLVVAILTVSLASAMVAGIAAG